MSEAGATDSLLERLREVHDAAPAATAEQQRAFLGGDEIAYDGVISALWREKMDTNQIARHLRVRESLVANRLAALRDSGAL